jgi:hypothetical protein
VLRREMGGGLKRRETESCDVGVGRVVTETLTLCLYIIEDSGLTVAVENVARPRRPISKCCTSSIL